MKKKGVKIVLAGPPRSGKSCMREGLKQSIRALPGAPYPYVITACPDGEGSWFQETVNACPEFVRRVSDSMRNCALELTLVDVGGIPSEENKKICAHATHVVLLAGNDQKTGENWSDRLDSWREFAEEVGLTVVAEIFSDYHGAEDAIEGVSRDGVLRGGVHHLERGENTAERPMIRVLAETHLPSIGGTPCFGESGDPC